MWEGYQLGRTWIPLWSLYSDGTKLQLEDVLSQVLDILFHLLGPLSSAISAAETGYFEIQMKALQLVLA